MQVIETSINGVVIIEPKLFKDNRGYFYESFNVKEFNDKVGSINFVQDNESKSSYGVLRGIHFQKPPFSQAKLVRVIKGKVLDIAVDLRKGSPTYGQWEGVYLSAENKRQFYVPEGFAHGFVVLSDVAEFSYKCTDFYHPNDEGGLAWNDPEIGVEWPIPEDMELTISEKDQKWPGIASLKK